MKRREFMLLLSATMAPGRSLRAQKKAMPVIGQLSSGPPPGDLGDLVRGPIHQGMAEMGFVEGQNTMWSTAGPRAIMIGCPYWPPTSSAAVST